MQNVLTLAISTTNLVASFATAAEKVEVKLTSLRSSKTMTSSRCGAPSQFACEVLVVFRCRLVKHFDKLNVF